MDHPEFTDPVAEQLRQRAIELECEAERRGEGIRALRREAARARRAYQALAAGQPDSRAAFRWSSPRSDQLLIYMRQQPGPLHLSTICSDLGLTYNQTGGVLLRLVRLGLLSRPGRGLYAVSPTARAELLSTNTGILDEREEASPETAP